MGKDIMGVDMLYLSYKLTRVEYNEAFERIQEYLKKKHPSDLLHRVKKGSDTYITYAFRKHGFQEIRLRKTVYGDCTIEIRFRPQLVINNQGYYVLTLVSEFNDVKVGFNYVIQDVMGLSVPDFYKWKAQRVEATVDISVQEELIPFYLQLFKCGNVPDYFFAKKQTNERWDSITNVYLMGSKITVNWYDRYETIKIKEMKSVKKSGKEFQDYTETKGMLRFETQLRKNNRPMKEMLDQGRLKAEVLRHYKQIVGEGDYYTMEKALAILREAVENPGKRLELMRLLTLIDECGSVFEAKKRYMKGKDAKAALDKFSKRINQLRKLGINPVVLPEEWGLTYLKNLYNKIEKA
ncbi:MAG: hypothetical protein WDZ91_03655 [Paenibacillaceae bacterium]